VLLVSFFFIQDNRMSEDHIRKLLLEKGLSSKAVAGIMANIEVETGGSYDYTQKQIKGPGRGLFQLDPTGPLPKAYKSWLGKREDSAASQIDFMYDTVYGGNQDVIGRGHAKKLRTSFEKGSAEDVAKEFSNRWERPGIPHMERRIEAAKRLYSKDKAEIEMLTNFFKKEQEATPNSSLIQQLTQGSNQ